MSESLLTGAVVVAVISLVGVAFATLAPMRDVAADRKRTRYAEAVGALVEWFEMPYRVARRVNDEDGTVQRLAESSHDLQIRLVTHQSWIAGESVTVHRAYRATVSWLKEHCKSALQAAWEQPVSTSMNIGDLGLDQSKLEDRIAELNVLIGSRFGWGRFRLPSRIKAWLKHK